MPSTVTSILSVGVTTASGPWSGQAIGDQDGSAVVQDPTKVRMELQIDRALGVWAITARSLCTEHLSVQVDAAWRPTGELTGPIWVVGTTGAQIEGRVITKDGGVITGHRIDPAGPLAFVRDRYVVQLEPGNVIVATGQVAPCEPADLDGNGKVDASDLAICLGEWGTAHVAADINRDGIVNATDLAELLSALTNEGSAAQ